MCVCVPCLDGLILALMHGVGGMCARESVCVSVCVCVCVHICVYVSINMCEFLYVVVCVCQF